MPIREGRRVWSQSAGRALARPCAWSEGFDTQDLKDAKALLDELR